jgi:manganese oxidase
MQPTRRQVLAGGASLGGMLIAKGSASAQASPPGPGEASAIAAPAADSPELGRLVTPNGTSLPWRENGGVKVFHLIAEPVEHEIAPGLVINAWGYNGRVHGPTIEAVEGDRCRFYVTNRLPGPTTVHWHGMILPNGMDGVGGLTQPYIRPGETFRYEFSTRHPGTFMYHPHMDEMTQIALGLTGLFVVHPRRPEPAPRPVRDYALLLHEWKVRAGSARPDPLEMVDFNVLTINAKSGPATAPLVAETGDLVRIRIANLSPMNHHPIHIHGHAFEIVETDGGPIPASARWPETTVLVPVGSARVVEFIADAPGDWAVHCHMTHHMMNQMGHDAANKLGADLSEAEEKIRSLIPGYHAMGQAGMAEMAAMDMPVPRNSIPMLGQNGPFDPIELGGMSTFLKVRDRLPDDRDPGWYDHPEDTVAREATADELRADGVDPGA